MLYGGYEVEDSFKLKTESKILSNTSNPTLDLNNGVKSYDVIVLILLKRLMFSLLFYKLDKL